MGRPMPKGLGRSLALRILAYQQQAQQFGDLDKGSQRELAALVSSRRASPASSDVADGDMPASSDASASKGRKTVASVILTRRAPGHAAGSRACWRPA